MRLRCSVNMVMLLVLPLITLTAGCSDIKDIETTRVPPVDGAVCILRPTDGNSVRGVVTFTRMENGVRITADVRGLAPGRHGFHIHQYGDMRSPDGKSAAGHYNPGGNRHGGPSDAERHAGDLGNLTAGEDSTARYERLDSVIRLNGAKSIIGRAVIVHADEDDLTSQPTGNAGARVAGGVIGIANPDYEK